MQGMYATAFLRKTVWAKLIRFGQNCGEISAKLQRNLGKSE